ncbi:DDE-type integrase/transposase/recombinase, partial [Arcicella sp. DC2W]
YLSLLTDAYSNKVVGFQVGESLEVKHCLLALQMAIDRERAYINKNLIHHSDRGIQYGCSDYTTLLEENNIAISMTTNSDPLEKRNVAPPYCRTNKWYY